MSRAFSDILVAPYDGLMGQGTFYGYHRGGPVWPKWKTQVDPRHCRDGRPIDRRPPPPETWREIGEAQWCGPIFDHFGHMLAEFSMRILPSALNGNPAPLLFYGFPPERYRRRARPVRAAPAYFRQILRYAGLRPGDVLVETGGLKVGTLHVEPQAEQMYRPGPSADHLDRLDGHAERMLGPVVRTGPVFVSRAGQFARFAGEAYLEEVMKAAGVTVIRPETLPLAEQLKIYRAASPVIFSDGSAMHTPQLLGRCFDRVAVFRREDGTDLNATCLAPRCESLEYHSIHHDVVELPGPDGSPWRIFSLTLTAPERFLAAMRAIGIAVDHLWDAAAFAAARDRDVADWLAAVRGNPLWARSGAAAKAAARIAGHFGDRFAGG